MTDTSPPAIVRVLRVVDTRDLIEDGDRWIRLPGTGEPRQCARCHRTHEVHVHVELQDGSQAIVGRSCAQSPSMDFTSRIRALLAASERLARLHRQLSTAETQIAAYNAAQEAVQALPLPPVETLEPDPAQGSPRAIQRTLLRMGDASVYCWPDRDYQERLAALTRRWRSNRLAEHGFGSDAGLLHYPPESPESLRRQIHSLETKLASMEVQAT